VNRLYLHTGVVQWIFIVIITGPSVTASRLYLQFVGLLVLMVLGFLT